MSSDTCIGLCMLAEAMTAMSEPGSGAGKHRPARSAGPTLVISDPTLLWEAAVKCCPATTMPLPLEARAVGLSSKAVVLGLLGRGVILGFVLAPDPSAGGEPSDCCLQGACCCQMGTLSLDMPLLACLVGDVLGEAGAATLRCFCSGLVGVAGGVALSCSSICLLGVTGAAGDPPGTIVLECCFISLPLLSNLAIELRCGTLPVRPML